MVHLAPLTGRQRKAKKRGVGRKAYALDLQSRLWGFNILTFHDNNATVV